MVVCVIKGRLFCAYVTAWELAWTLELVELVDRLILAAADSVPARVGAVAAAAVVPEVPDGLVLRTRMRAMRA